MPNTLNRSYPWPSATQTADPRLDLQRLAEAVDADVTKILGTLPYRANSLASLNAQAGARIGDRAIITDATNATENGEYAHDGAQWKQQNAIINATMQTGWNGNVQWVRSGSLITVSVNVGRTAGNFQVPAWTGTRLALGLPVPAAGFIGQAPVESNGYEWPRSRRRLPRTATSTSSPAGRSVT